MGIIGHGPRKKARPGRRVPGRRPGRPQWLFKGLDLQAVGDHAAKALVIGAVENALQRESVQVRGGVSMSQMWSTRL